MELSIPVVGGVPPDTVHVRVRNGAAQESTIEVPVFATPAAVGVADVAIGSVYAEPVAGDTAVVFRVVLRNRGTAATPPGVAHVVDLLVGDTVVERFDAHSEPLAPGASIELVTPPLPFAPGNYSATAIADPDDLIPARAADAQQHPNGAVRRRRLTRRRCPRPPVAQRSVGGQRRALLADVLRPWAQSVLG